MCKQAQASIFELMEIKQSLAAKERKRSDQHLIVCINFVFYLYLEAIYTVVAAAWVQFCPWSCSDPLLVNCLCTFLASFTELILLIADKILHWWTAFAWFGLSVCSLFCKAVLGLLIDELRLHGFAFVHGSSFAKTCSHISYGFCIVATSVHVFPPPSPVCKTTRKFHCAYVTKISTDDAVAISFKTFGFGFAHGVSFAKTC